ncbi:MAG TPA: MASE1 domain-containing protein [Chloroflexota bacterium]|nr:MASE1 domain-containing protein [Chloroflexota bacterium]
MTWRSAGRSLLLNGVLAVLYVLTARAGLRLATVAGPVTLVWPPAGLDLAALWLGGLRLWPGLALGVVLINVSTGGTLVSDVGIGLGNTLEAVLPVLLLRRVDFRPSLDRLRDVGALLVLAAGLSPLVSATIGVPSLALAGAVPRSVVPAAWGTWWLGDALGVILVAPALLVWATYPLRWPTRRRVGEAALLLAATLAASLAVFGGWLGTSSLPLPLVYLVFPLLLWAALRFGLPGVVTLTPLVAGVALWYTAQARGPFGEGGLLRDDLLQLQLFLGAVGIAGLLLAAAVTERESALRRVWALNVDLTRANTDLAQANAELEKASRAKSEFLATMSHEIRTPLNGVIGLTSLLQSTPLSPRQREYVGGIQASGEALLGLINDILDFSKIEAGQLSLERQPFDLGHLIGEVVDQFRGQARAKGLELSAHVDPAVPPLVLGDVGRLRQVLLNLVGNALKFTAQGAVGVQVGVVEESAEGVLLRITVRDTGIGIAPEAQARLFEPFTQADAATTRRYGGTGLGLAIAKRLVERMDGEIGVESALGQGSTFWVQLPLARAAAGVVPPAVRMQLGPVAPAPEVAESGTRGHILVAEDNAINRLVVVGLLQGLGYAVETAENGRQAAEAVGRGHYDLVLMDLHMPELDGFAATAAIRRDEAAEGKGRRVPIVALTADALPGDAEKSLVAGMDDHLTKPITPKRLATVVERWVKSGTVSE